jgi:hypothetical protein
MRTNLTKWLPCNLLEEARAAWFACILVYLALKLPNPTIFALFSLAIRKPARDAVTAITLGIVEIWCAATGWLQPGDIAETAIGAAQGTVC